DPLRPKTQDLAQNIDKAAGDTKQADEKDGGLPKGLSEKLNRLADDAKDIAKKQDPQDALAPKTKDVAERLDNLAAEARDQEKRAQELAESQENALAKDLKKLAKQAQDI